MFVFFFSGFHDNVLQDFVVIAEKIESNFLNHYDFEYITPSQTYSNVTVELKENWIITGCWIQDYW